MAAVRTAARTPSIVLPSPGFIHVWQRHLDVARSLWRSRLVMPLVEPLLTFMVLGFGLGRFVELDNGMRYRDFIAPGMLAVFPMWQVVFACTWEAWIRMDSQHTYDAMISTPLGPEDVVAGDVAWGTTSAMISTFYVFLMALAFGSVNSPWALLVFPIAVVHGALLGSIAFWYMTTAKTSDSLSYFFTIAIMPMFWFGDVFFPNSSLPEPLQVAGWFVPTTHTVAIYRGALEGSLEWGMLGHLAWLIVVAAAFFLLAIRGLRRRLLT